MPRCPSCEKDDLEKKDFYRTKTKRGFSAYCKVCTRKKAKAQKLSDNIGNYQKSQRAYREKNSAKLSEYQKEYRANNPEKIKGNNAKSNKQRSEKRLSELNNRVKYLERIIEMAAIESQATPNIEKDLLERLIAQAI